MMHLRQPLAVPADRPLRVLIQARYSTEEQRQSSLEDQVANCRRFLADNLPPGVGLDRLAIEVVREPEISGELLNRPGINEVWQGIAAGRFEVLVAEESSRLYRHMTFAGQLFNEAVDAGIRVLCPTDFIDTQDDDWPERLLTSQSQHSRANYYTRGRIRRAQLGLWDRGAAVSSLRPGYHRRPTKAATATEPAQGPYFDEVDEEQAVTIREIFERIAADEPAWAVGEWLTSIGFSKGSHGQQPEWSARNVIALVRRPDYRGEQTFRKKINKQQLTTGRSRRVRNAADQVLTREMPHLRIVSDHVWYEANAAIDRRRTRLTVPTGADHPLAGRPRDSRGLLSTIFVCGICGGTMHAEGRNEGGYRCARARNNECWNRTTCVREQTHAAVLDAVVREVMSLAESREALVARVLELHASGGDVAASQRALESEQAKLTASIANLCLAIEKGGEGMDALVQRLATRERDLKVVRSRLTELAARAQQRRPPPTADEILRHLETLKADLVAGDRRAGVILRQLLQRPIRAIPHRQFDSNKVVLRCEFDLVLSRSLPAAIAASMAVAPDGTSPEQSLESRRIVVDLFVPSALALHAVEAHELVETGLPLVKVGATLGISKRQAHLCSGLGAKMASAGVADPFIRLSERPAKVARWRAAPTQPLARERRAG
jgi:site-specific DNA recombinase